MTNLECKISYDPIAYEQAMDFMEERVSAIINGAENELIWLLTHESVYTAGSLAKENDLLDPNLKVINTNRGGQYTYHGPGQRVIYVMLDLKKRSLQDIRAYVKMLEETIIKTLEEFGIRGRRREGRVGIWVTHHLKEYKIAALGVRVKKWITMHGVAVNIDPDLSYYNKIVPCGIKEYGTTSLKALGIDCSTEEFDRVYLQKFLKIFNEQKISLI
jgi:lipoyl(octanoyl) transferase